MVARKIKLGEFFLRAKQFATIAEFEAKELEKAKIYTSLRQASAILFSCSIIVLILAITDLELDYTARISDVAEIYTNIRPACWGMSLDGVLTSEERNNLTTKLFTEFTGREHLPQNIWYVRQDVMLEFSKEWEKVYGWKNGTGYRKMILKL